MERGRKIGSKALAGPSRRVPLAADAAGDCQPVHLRPAHVEHDQVGLLMAGANASNSNARPRSAAAANSARGICVPSSASAPAAGSRAALPIAGCANAKASSSTRRHGLKTGLRTSRTPV